MCQTLCRKLLQDALMKSDLRIDAAEDGGATGLKRDTDGGVR